MRKKTIKFVADTMFWYLLYFLPVLAFLLYIWNDSSTVLSFDSFLTTIGLDVFVDNVIIDTLVSLFGSQGVLPLFNGSTVFIIFGWYISVYLVHLAVDFLLFIPRYAHKLMNSYNSEVL